ncbi:hypothetical protein SCHPADRAFT_145720 [Schizopora paradoxa]|uniref:Uncharacterized protein n=1 Tax=Schizopora paradoxa TaxID=27342 RepID=A0A0H2S1J7_9AGAM|nr:hypothetical protein SCHPADRAFT_145720 [Schizopora paradoxa]
MATTLPTTTMSTAAQSPLNAVDIDFEKPGGPVQFENSSDTIFASLFLPVFNLRPEDRTYRHSDTDSEDSQQRKPIDFDSEIIPWQFCDRILEVLRNPLFSPKEVSFENCGDMFRRVGQKRQDKWSVVETRPACETFPLAILEGVLDILRAELDSQAFFDVNCSLSSRRCRGVVWRETLQNMVSVHSSWHTSVKRLLGHAIDSPRGPVPTTLQNPVFGGWTRALYLSYDPDCDIVFSNISVIPNRPHGYFLNSLCSRLANIRVVHLCLTEISDNAIEVICDALSSLELLEELNLETGDVLFPIHPTFSVISKAQHPTLQILRLFATSFTFEDISVSLCSLEILKKLHSVKLIYNMAHPAIGISGVSWTRLPPKRGYPFALNDIRMNCEPYLTLDGWQPPRLEDINEGIIKVLQSTKLVTLRFIDVHQGLYHVPPPSKICALLAPWLTRCSSARTLIIHQFPWSQMQTFELIWEQSGALSIVEELVIEVAHRPLLVGLRAHHRFEYVPEERMQLARAQFPIGDAELSRMVGAGLFPRLRTLKVTFPDYWLELCVERFHSEDTREGGGWGVEERRMLLPHCRKRCSERSIAFNVEVSS